MSQAPSSSNAQDPAQAAEMEQPGRAQLLQLHPIPSMEPSQEHQRLCSSPGTEVRPRRALLSHHTVKCPKQSFFKENKSLETEVTPEAISEEVHLKVCYQLFVPGSASDFSFRCDGS